MKKSKVGGVYSISIDKDGITYMYIGSTGDLESRFNQHGMKLKKGVHHCTKLQALYDDIGKYFVEILEQANDTHKLISTESEYIEHFRKVEGMEVLNVIKPYVSAERVYLKVSDVIRVKELLEKGVKTRNISSMTGIKIQQVQRIKTGERWGTVKIQGGKAV